MLTVSRRVAQLQKRLHIFETVWKQYLPDVDLSAAVHAVENQHYTDPVPKSSNSDTRSAFDYACAVDEALPVSTEAASIEPAPVSPHDSEYEDADTLDWDESYSVAAVADGIASLSIEWKGIGYMGHQTGNTLLRKLQ